MSDNKPQVIITADSAEILQKKTAWSEVGLTVHNLNINLKAKADQALAKLVMLPQNIDHVKVCEENLKLCKAELASIESDRKAFTSKLDAVTAGLMAHEKMVKDAIPAFQQAIIKVKAEYEAEQLYKKQAVEREKLAKEAAVNKVNQFYAGVRDLIANTCQKAYEYALGAGNVTEAKLPAYLNKVKAKFGKEAFEINPIAIGEHYEYAIKVADLPSCDDLLAFYHKSVDNKFEFYAVALKNKEAAIKAAKEQADKEALERAEALKSAEIAAKLETIATSEAEVVSDVKGLKKVYAIDMDDSEANSLLIIAAFVTNFNLVKDGIRTKNWFNVSVSQMGAALAWYKNKDENFKCSGINFKTVDKL